MIIAYHNPSDHPQILTIDYTISTIYNRSAYHSPTKIPTAHTQTPQLAEAMKMFPQFPDEAMKIH